jgi:predicted RNA-binding protein YlxR (DUF448 family)
MRPRHIPQRTCVSCRTTGEKRGLLRVVRQPDGTVLFDPTGKRSGRGAYVCASAACIALAEKQRRLARSLKVEISPTVFEALRACAAEDEPPSGTEE